MNAATYVDETEIAQLDFSRHSIALGVYRRGYEAPWVELDEVDLRILAMLLTRQLPGVSAIPAESSEALRLLAVWAQAGAEWLHRNSTEGSEG